MTWKTRTDKITISEGSRSLDTICGVHRRMYQILSDRDPDDEVLRLLRKAFAMAKRMNAKLQKYKLGHDDGWYEQHKLDGGEIDAEE
jgi:hypothetical protein